MRADETVLYSDLDGTLFNSRTEVSPENRAAIERYVLSGGRFALSTGRAPFNSLRFTGALPINAPSVVYNGAGVYDFAAGEYTFCDHLDRAVLDPLFIRLATEFPEIDIQLYTEREITSVTPEANAQPDLLRLHAPVRFTSPAAPEGLGLVKALAWVPPARYAALETRLRECAPGRYLLIPGTVPGAAAPVRFFELLPPGATKGAALRRLRVHPALAGRTLVAAGDYLNDLEMLLEADVAVCPANAAEEVKAVCRFVTVRNDDHAIARIIDDIIPAL